jgi:2-phospho-L-lactate guanylyltransferase (CobY/MobA/RfbA family)
MFLLQHACVAGTLLPRLPYVLTQAKNAKTMVGMLRSLKSAVAIDSAINGSIERSKHVVLPHASGGTSALRLFEKRIRITVNGGTNPGRNKTGAEHSAHQSPNGPDRLFRPWCV